MIDWKKPVAVCLAETIPNYEYLLRLWQGNQSQEVLVLRPQLVDLQDRLFELLGGKWNRDEIDAEGYKRGFEDGKDEGYTQGCRDTENKGDDE